MLSPWRRCGRVAVMVFGRGATVECWWMCRCPMRQTLSSNLDPYLTEFDDEEQMTYSSILKFCCVQENIPFFLTIKGLQKKEFHRCMNFFTSFPISSAAPISEGNLFRPSLHFRSGLPPLPSLGRFVSPLYVAETNLGWIVALRVRGQMGSAIFFERSLR